MRMSFPVFTSSANSGFSSSKMRPATSMLLTMRFMSSSGTNFKMFSDENGTLIISIWRGSKSSSPVHMPKLSSHTPLANTSPYCQYSRPTSIRKFS